MTNEERDLISRFIARVGGAQQSGGFLSGSVPASQPGLPPIDREADGFIGQQFQQYPEARYRITQMAVVTEAALAEAQNRIQRLEWELEQTRQAAQQAAQQAQQQPQQKSGGFLGGLFGGGQPQQQAPRPGYAPGPQQGAWNQGGYQPSAPPPQPQYAPGYQPGMFQRGGSGFLGSALTTAAGVAGGMVVGNALMNAFSGNHGSAMASTVSSPWGGSAGSTTDTSAFDGAGIETPSLGTDTGFSDPFSSGGGMKDPSFDTQTSWDQGGTADSGGFDSGGGSFDSGGGGGFDDNV